MAYDLPGRRRRGTIDGELRPSTMQLHHDQAAEPHDGDSTRYLPPSVQSVVDEADPSAPTHAEPHEGVQSYIPLSLPDEPMGIRRVARGSSGLSDGYILSSLREEHQDTRRPNRIPSPPVNDASLPISMVPISMQQQQPPPSTSISEVSPELIEHLTRRIKKEIFDELKQEGGIEQRAEETKIDSVSMVGLVDGQPNVEHNARVMSDDKSSLSPSPTLSTRRVYTPPSPGAAPRRGVVGEDSPPLSPTSPPGSPTKEKPVVRFTNSRGPVDKDGTKSTRPAAYRSFSNAELSAVDQKWGKLFEPDRTPTARLGQFLRGIANHFIKEVEPRNSMVVTPEKMALLYSNFALRDEAHPLLVSVFKSRSHDSVSVLYQILGCQHHLVQEEPNQLPSVPGLTPAGFAHWMTSWILAYPDQETARLQKMVETLPINADGQMVDGKADRLPKQISRHLFPNREDSNMRATISKEIKDFLDDLERSRKPKQPTTSSSFQDRPSAQPRTRPLDIPQKGSSRGVERDATPYNTPPTDTSCPDDTVPIERTRQPYVAQPGNGKVYMDSLSAPNSSRSVRANSTGRPTREVEPEPQIKHARTQSIISNNPYMPPPRPGGARRGPSPPLNKYSRSNPTSLDIGGTYPADHTQAPPYSASSYTPSSRLTGPASGDSRERDRERERDRDRDRDRKSERDRDRDRGRPRRERSRRNTIGDETPRPPIDTLNSRDPDRYARLYDERDRERDGLPVPVLHQELRGEHRNSLPLPTTVPDEEWYRGAVVSTRSDRSGGEYETDRSKYNARR